MKLTDLNPRWIGTVAEGYGMGLSFDCPCGCGVRCYAPVPGPEGGGPPIERTDTTFEALRLQPAAKGGWEVATA